MTVKKEDHQVGQVVSPSVRKLIINVTLISRQLVLNLWIFMSLHNKPYVIYNAVEYTKMKLLVLHTVYSNVLYKGYFKVSGLRMSGMTRC
jgi:hypothetical protein